MNGKRYKALLKLWEAGNSRATDAEEEEEDDLLDSEVSVVAHHYSVHTYGMGYHRRMRMLSKTGRRRKTMMMIPRGCWVMTGTLTSRLTRPF